MDRRLAADPLHVAGPLCATPGGRFGEELQREPAASARIECIGLGDAEGAPQVAARQVKQVR
ncbi:MAG TPA: hypothetical protein VGX76_10305, partial [Pirellulales bacterium]|nr:hypothetical protein [Pirellulales bacterium]